MDMKTFAKVATALPAEMAILMRGPTGVGKSHMAKRIAEELDLPYIDVRGSTMDESQVSGIPDFETSKTTNVATFCLPSFYVRACREPVVLMLDELNRSMPQVMQSFFQIVLDRELGNNVDGEPLRLHPDTRVIAAVNFGGEYDVNDMDPALLRRFWVVDLMPTHEDWIKWARENELDEVLIDFINQHPEHLRVEPSAVDPGTVIPTNASWHRLNTSLVHMGMAPSEVAGETPEGFYAVCSGFVGAEAAIAFSDFVKRYEMQISAEDVLAGKVDAKRATGLDASVALGVINKLAKHATDNDWGKSEATRVAAFLDCRSGEQLTHFWTELTKGQNLTSIKACHPLMCMKVVELINLARKND